MKPLKGYYSLIQYCPDRSRQEVANIGLVVYVPEIHFLSAKLSRSNARMRHFFGHNSIDNQRINFLKSSIENRLTIEKDRFTSFDDFEKFVNTRANELILTTPRPIKIGDPQQDTNALFQELIGERARARTSRKLFPHLDHTFRDRLKDRMHFDLSVEVPFANRTIQIPYAYRNGVNNLIRPQAFGPNAADTGLRLAAEGELLQKYPEENAEPRKLILLPKIERVTAPALLRSSLTELFNRFDIRTVWEDQLERFEAEVEKEAHPHTEL